MFGSPLAAEPAFSLTVDPYWILVSLVQFLILYWLLRRFLWVPVTKALETRAAKIREGLELAEEARLDRERLKQEVETLLAQARAEANAIADRTAQAAEAAAAATRAEAKTEADRLRERGRLDARQLHDQALAQLRGELASMVVLAASRLLGREISAEQHRALIEQSLSEAGSELRKN
ncbi:MAG: F0F1 ATP synthase subunit B [Chloroflexi bacterium]|nr:MAG: F0F1 ATP synthase subunit B [Chloroflexota bacterium]TMB93328.1 MAG: F0F1 ATP synthase subunit B [Chloroflexota bacterium]TMC30637.1 MAG: F0F1 ATP synthase subunit B [Chloroflexota bacterium]TMC33317.1 MAG: F0F1 ATP synthase subunit B [Chloroflexota bacterium]TMC55802.1 MAG: F0F1 ATP synthase subunit B [Chloroflexota bacterium]